MTRSPRTGLALILLACGSVSTASEGVHEINAACIATGCFAGDDPGWPVRIVNSGSYRLTSDLVLSDSDGSAIITQEVGGSFPENLDITLDLNGFSIIGPTTCPGFPPTCSPIGDVMDPLDGYGIAILSSGFNSTARIHGGTIRGMPVAGLVCQPECTVKDITARENALGGISVDGRVINSQAARNGDAGISISNNGLIEGCVSRQNANHGLFGSGVFTNNTSIGNVGHGIFANPDSVVRSNRLTNNATGLRCIDCLAVDNVISDNDNAGIDFESNTGAIGRNLIQDNGTNLSNATGAVQIDTNVCDAAPCP